MAKRPGQRRRHTALERRIREACCEFHGLTPHEYDNHIAGIVRMVEQANAGQRLPRRRAA